MSVYTFKDFEGSSHRILISLIRRYARRRGTLVDLGAAGGEIGATVRPLFDRTFGFEYDSGRMGDLRPRFDQVVIADLEKATALPSGAAAVLMADVLEHLRDPRAILSLVRRSMDPEGYVFMSVPNIANVTTRIGLLFGIFRYRDRGILDFTHLRFYTMGTIRDEVEGAGFEVVAVRGSSIPVRLIVGGVVPDVILRPVEWVLARVTQVWKALFAYQIIFVLRPRDRRVEPRS